VDGHESSFLEDRNGKTHKQSEPSKKLSKKSGFFTQFFAGFAALCT
jgi:hypothetical protein